MAIIYLDQYHTGVYQEHFTCEQGITLYHALLSHGYTLSGATCAGAGICRGCMVMIAEEGMECLACHYRIHTNELHVQILSSVPEQHILLYEQDPDSTLVDNHLISDDPNLLSAAKLETEASYGVAVDLGTTTLASALVDLNTGKVVSQAGCMNRQARYGADVISRIQYACEKEQGLTILHDLVWEDIEHLLAYYQEQGYSKESIQTIQFVGNTTMLHFLLGHNVQGLAAYPFSSDLLSAYFGSWQDVHIQTASGRSAFVGSDITVGAAVLGLGKTESYDLLIDLGTNGELCLLNQNRGVCTSTSCGPAFANSVMNGRAYGSTLLDQLSEHYLAGDLDDTGLLHDPYFETGIICGEYVITQDTIRAIQLAKAAIRTGIELAAYELRLPLDEIAHVYLAGGFGFHLNLDSAFTLGLFPKELYGRIQIVGNTALQGAVRLLTEPTFSKEADSVLANCQVLDLSMNKNFQEFFIHRLNFPKDL